ncbi:uncharacterized protein LOC131053463 [Cryptomeria japonica]|uniref:uncharacterized protein LOC131053463 n=1 Tax=Cryptomeria japonica TaxID=3369 RepID=UPI0027DA2FB1|nr:uncharacterized protein LOC131053463 [Cryptomeria japonica]
MLVSEYAVAMDFDPAKQGDLGTAKSLEKVGDPYAGVILSEREKEVALFLCVDDWNYEVVYWLLNSWTNYETMNVGDVRRGNIPISDVANFEEMNKMMGHLARRLGEEGGKALENSGKTKYYGKDSVKEVLSGMIKIVTEEEDVVQFMGSAKWKFTYYEGDEYFLPVSAKMGDVAEPFWCFVCDSFAGYAVETCALTSLLDIREMQAKSTSQNALMIATSILLHLSDFRTDIIHEPLAHDCKGSCANHILRHAADTAADNPQKFNEMLKNNAMCRCYDETRNYSDETRNYGVLDKLLVIVAKQKYYDIEEEEKLAVVDILLQCGAQPARCDAIGKYKNKTVLHSVAKFRNEDVGTEVAEALLCMCKDRSVYDFVNAKDERGRTALHSASEKGNARICRLLVDRGTSVNAQDKKGKTALHCAFEGRIDNIKDVWTEIAQVLLCWGDEETINEFANAADESGRTALHIASEKGNVRSCELLVDQGASVIAQDKKGMTALHYAFEGRIDKVIGVGIEIAQTLLRRCDKQSVYEFVNATDKSGRTALHGASEKGNARICELLTGHGASVTAQDNKNMTALHYAFEGKIEKVKGVGIEIAQALLRRCDEHSMYEFVNASSHRGRTALHGASEKGNKRICEELLDRGASVTAKDKEDTTALHYALEGGIIEIAQVLLRRCDDTSMYEFVNVADKKGRTALHCASEKANAQICGLLADRGASVITQDEKGMTALHYAVKAGSIEIAQVLLNRCDEASIYGFVNAADIRGRTALHWASHIRNTRILALLLHSGTLVIRQDKNSMTALHCAFEKGIGKFKNVVEEIAQALLSSCNEQSIYEFVNAADNRRRTSLHLASLNGSTYICQLLVDCGVSLTAKDKNGKTALHYAFEGRIDKVLDVGIEIAQTLLSRCDEQSVYEFVNAVDESGKTALHSASENGKAVICELLVDRGASVTAQDKDGMTTLHYAFEGGIDKDIDVATEIAQALLGKCPAESIYEFVNATDVRWRTALHRASEKGNACICELLLGSSALATAQDEKGMTALHYAFEGGFDKDIDVGIDIAGALLRSCNEQNLYEFVNAVDKRGRTALHSASEKGNARICGLLVDHGASVTVQDERNMTPLHYALDGRFDEVIDALLKSSHATKSLNLKDNRGYTPLGVALTNMDHKSTVKLLLQSKEPEADLGKALTNMNYETTAKLLLKPEEPEAYLDIALPQMDSVSTAKLLSKLKKPEAYFNKVDQEQLLRNSLILGSVNIVNKLFTQGIKQPAADEDGKTALHLAAMCNDQNKAIKIIYVIIGEKFSLDVKTMIAKRDKADRTVLHDAALNGHKELCLGLLNINSDLIYAKDRDGRNPLYDAVEGKWKGKVLCKQLLTAYLKKDRPNDDLMDRSGLTPLHVAASQGNVQILEELLSRDKIRQKYLSRGDFLEQTALHKAVSNGHIDTVEILLKHGAHPLREHDRDGRTTLHYAVRVKTEDKMELVRKILQGCELGEEKLLLLWASAAGLGTADQDLDLRNPEDEEVHKFLLDERERLKKGNLLKIAVSLENVEMTKELISRGYQIGDICDPRLPESNKESVNETVNRVLRQIKMIKEQGNDKPTIFDSLGRLDYAQGLAALFLNPYIKPPIAVGITGSWGTGKSSLMLQTERILMTTAAQMALLPSSKLSRSASQLPDIKPCKLSNRGISKCEHIYRQLKRGERANRNIFIILWDYIRSKLKQTNEEKIQKKMKKLLNEYEKKFLNQYDIKYLKVFKALAAMDSGDMLQSYASRPKADLSVEENVPAVLTVQYNAWKYRNDTEALAGIAVEITKELEGIMTQAQWLNTCWRNSWKKKKYTLWIEIFFPSLLALVLASSFTWIAWVVFDSDKLKEWGKAKYAWPPAALVIIVWTLTKSAMGILKPVSTQLMQYISFPDHSNKLGYQERVISDISFLKDEIGRKACWVFIVFSWVFTAFTVLWDLISKSFIKSLLLHDRSHEKAIQAPKIAPAPGSNLRIIVFVDDLDRCQESVILQVLSAVNLVLAVCEINVVIGMDKRLIERAIIKKYKDINVKKSVKANQEFADMYLQKIIQLPLDLPDPRNEESRSFLRGELGVLDNENVALTNEDGS